MKKNRFALIMMALVMATTAVFANPAPKKGSARYVVNPAQTSLSWLAKKVTGEHAGIVPVSNGEIILENGLVKAGSFTIDMTKIAVTDIKDADMNAKLVGHLKNDDFFGVTKFPSANFVITSVAAGKTAGTYTVKGNLTIKGITKPIEFPATISVKNNVFTAQADITVDRTQFDIRYSSKSFFDNLGDKVIYDEFTLTLLLVANKQ